MTSYNSSTSITLNYLGFKPELNENNKMDMPPLNTQLSLDNGPI